MKKIIWLTGTIMITALANADAQSQSASAPGADTAAVSEPKASRMETGPQNSSKTRNTGTPEAVRVDTTGAAGTRGTPEPLRQGPANKPK